MLRVEGIDVFYGQVQALDNVSITLGASEIISIIGSNGAGKSTLMRTIMGKNTPTTGEIYYKDKPISAAHTHRVVKQGIVYIPEGREVFPQMSVRDNLEMGAYSKRFSKAQLNELFEEMYALFPRLGERQKQHAGLLSGGEQQMLAIARGLMSRPEMILFDEPSLGLAPVLVDEMFDAIVKINDEMKIPVIIVEQNAYMALMVSSRAYVLENGRVVMEGSSGELVSSPEIKKAYLGG